MADVTLTGQLAVVSVTPDGCDNARYTALKMGAVTVPTSTTSAAFGLTGTIDINRLDYNGVEGDFDRLDWSTLELDPGADLPTPVDLTIDYNREFIHRIVGHVTGTGGAGTQLLEAGPVTISGATDFASTRHLTSEVESLTDATLDSLAINCLLYTSPSPRDRG